MLKPLTNPIERRLLESAAPPPRSSVLVMDGQSITWSESPARQLHDLLVTSFVAPPSPDEAAFSPRKKLAILVGASSLLWLIIGALAAAVI